MLWCVIYTQGKHKIVLRPGMLSLSVLTRGRHSGEVALWRKRCHLVFQARTPGLWTAPLSTDAPSSFSCVSFFFSPENPLFISSRLLPIKFYLSLKLWKCILCYPIPVILSSFPLTGCQVLLWFCAAPFSACCLRTESCIHCDGLRHHWNGASHLRFGTFCWVIYQIAIGIWTSTHICLQKCQTKSVSFLPHSLSFIPFSACIASIYPIPHAQWQGNKLCIFTLYTKNYGESFVCCSFVLNYSEFFCLLTSLCSDKLQCLILFFPLYAIISLPSVSQWIENENLLSYYSCISLVSCYLYCVF